MVHELSTCNQSHDIPTAISHTTSQLRSVTRHPNCDQSHDTRLRSVTRHHARKVQSHDTMHARFSHTTPCTQGSVTRHPDCDQSHDIPTAISHTTPCTQCSVTRHPTAISHTTSAVFQTYYSYVLQLILPLKLFFRPYL
jgi:hypothetical protein